MSAALALQKALRARLIADAGVTALVPATSIFDRHARPETFPCIVMGEDQEVADDLTLDRHHIDVFPTLHIWKREEGLTGVKAIAGAVRSAVRVGLPALDSPYGLVDIRYEGARFLRDPDGVTAHAVVTFEALIGGAA